MVGQAHMVYRKELPDYMPPGMNKNKSQATKVYTVRPPLHAQPVLRQTSSPGPRQQSMSAVHQPLVSSRLRSQFGAQAHGSAAVEASATISTASSSQASPTASPPAGSPFTARYLPVSSSASAPSVGLPPQPVSDGRWEDAAARGRVPEADSTARSVSPYLGSDQASRSHSRIDSMGAPTFMQDTFCSRLKRVSTPRSRSASAGRDLLSASAGQHQRVGGSRTPRSTSPALRNPGRHLGTKLGRSEEAVFVGDAGGVSARSSRSSTPQPARSARVAETSRGQQPTRRRPGLGNSTQPLGAEVASSGTSHARKSATAEAAQTSSPGHARIGWDAPTVGSASPSPVPSRPAASVPAEPQGTGAMTAQSMWQPPSTASPKVRPPLSEDREKASARAEDAARSSTAPPRHCAPRSLDFEHGREPPAAEPDAGDGADVTDEVAQGDTPSDHGRSGRVSNLLSSPTGAWASEACPCPQALASPGSREPYPRAPPPSPGANASAGEQMLPVSGLPQLPPQAEENRLQEYDCDEPPEVGEYAKSASSTSSWADDAEAAALQELGGAAYRGDPYVPRCLPLSPIREVSERVEAGRLTPGQANGSPAAELREERQERNDERYPGAGQFYFNSHDRVNDADTLQGSAGWQQDLTPHERYAQLRMAFLDS